MDWLMLGRRVASAATGTALLAGSILLILAGIRIPGVGIPYELGGADYELDMSFFIYLGAMIAGIGCIANALKLSRLPANIIVSFPVSRFIPGLLLLAVGIAGIIYYGVEVGVLNREGTWMFLGGLSLFYPVSMLPLLYGAAILVVCAFSFAKIKFTRRDGVLCIDELRFPRAMSTEIPLQDIQVASLSNTRTGIKYLWILLFIIPVVFLYIDGISFLVNPNTFGKGIIIGWVYVASASIQLFCMLLIVLNGQHVMQVLTRDRLYELHFYPVNLESVQRANLPFVLGMPARDEQASDPVAIQQPRDFKRLACGVAFLAAGIASRVFYLGAGEILRFVLVIAGIILVVEAIKNDLRLAGRGARVRSIPGEAGEAFLVSGGGTGYRTEHYFQGVRQLAAISPATFEEANATIQLRKLTAIDHIIASVVSFVAGFQAWPVLALVPQALLVSFTLPRVALLAGLLAVLAMAMLAPARVVKVKLGDRNVQVPVKMQGSFLGNLARKWSIVVATQGLQLVLRVVEIAISFGLGLLASWLVFVS